MVDDDVSNDIAYCFFENLIIACRDKSTAILHRCAASRSAAGTWMRPGVQTLLVSRNAVDTPYSRKAASSPRRFGARHPEDIDVRGERITGHVDRRGALHTSLGAHPAELDIHQARALEICRTWASVKPSHTSAISTRNHSCVWLSMSVITTRPPGRVTRAISCTMRCGSGAWWSTILAKVASAWPASNGRRPRCPAAIRHWRGPARAYSPARRPACPASHRRQSRAGPAAPGPPSEIPSRSPRRPADRPAVV